MATRSDITSRQDIELLITTFYDNVKQDPLIGIVFTELIPITWEHHIPLIVDFWETILLDNPVYKGNAMEKHFHINRIFPLKKIHFDAWLSTFNATVDNFFEGPVADLAKKRAAGIAGLMNLKMNENGPNKMGI